MILVIKVCNIYTTLKKKNPKATKIITFSYQRYYYENLAVFALYIDIHNFFFVKQVLLRGKGKHIQLYVIQRIK